jgi:endonuclease YncB( thermonuclease family)
MLQSLALIMALQTGPLLESRQAEVVASDMIVISGQRVRLWGLRVPEPGAMCASEGELPYSCEEEARTLLVAEIERGRESLEFLAGQIHRQYEQAPSLRCELFGSDDDGVALARCSVLNPSCIPQRVECDEEWIDLARAVITDGSGVSKREQVGAAYDEAEAAARLARFGVWGVADGAGVAPVNGG